MPSLIIKLPSFLSSCGVRGIKRFAMCYVNIINYKQNGSFTSTACRSWFSYKGVLFITYQCLKYFIPRLKCTTERKARQREWSWKRTRGKCGNGGYIVSLRILDSALHHKFLFISASSASISFPRYEHTRYVIRMHLPAAEFFFNPQSWVWMSVKCIVFLHPFTIKVTVSSHESIRDWPHYWVTTGRAAIT